MLRSPIFIFLFLFTLLSCNDSSKTKTRTSTATIENKNKLQARIYLEKGISYYTSQKFDSAFYYYNRSKILYELEKDSVGVVYNLIQMASTQQIAGDYFGSEKSALESLTYAPKKSIYEAAAYNLLGISSKALHNYNDALYYYEKAKLTTKDTVPQISLENNKASVYIEKKEFGTSIKILESILKSTVLDTVFVTKSRALDNLGYSYYKVNRIQEGLDLMTEALAIRERRNDSFGIIGSNLHLSEYFLKSDPKKANEYALTAYHTAMSIHSIDERLESLSFLINNDLKNGNHNYAISFIRLNDSIIKVRNNAKNQFAKIKYDVDQNRTENLKLRTQETESALLLEKQKNSKLLLGFILVAFITVAFFTYYYLAEKNKKEKLQATYQAETRLSKKVHDELANDVFNTMTFAEAKDLAEGNNKQILLTNLDNIYSRTRNISKENSTIETNEHFFESLKEMIQGYRSEQVNMILKDSDAIDWNRIEENKKIVVYRVIQELLVNMKKHSQCSLVLIRFQKTKNTIEVNYSDNGVGMDLDIKISKSGLKNVETRVASIQGTTTFDAVPNKGVKVYFSFPA